jgi:heterodisulfide reductase subunit A-like polyferredoxin
MIYEKDRRYIIPFYDLPSPRAEMPEISVEERRGNFTEVETGFPEKTAVQEARRCLSCRRCLGCALCWAECKPEAIDFSIPDEELELEFDEIVITGGQDNGFHPLNPELGFGNYPNVITDLQFERMLSPTGPTGGLVLSPSNGEIASNIAIIQGHPEEDENHLLSSLIFGVNESIIALGRTESLEVVLVSTLCESFGEGYLSEAEKITGLQIVEGAPESVRKARDGDALNLVYSQNGKTKEGDFDLVVILTKPKLSSEIKSLSRKLEQDVL